MRALARLAFGAVVLTALWWSALEEPLSTGMGDWVYFHRMWETGRVALERYGALPYWEAHHCGGLTLWGNPQAMVYGPFFLLSPLIGSTLALKVLVAAHLLAAFYGAHRLAAHYGIDELGAYGAALVFGCSGFFAWHLGGGHAAFAPFCFAPLLLLAWRKAASDLRYVALVVALLTLTLFEGGVYPLPFFALLLGFDSLTRIRREPRAVLTVGISAAVLTVGAVAARLIPILQTLARFPRNTPPSDALAPSELWTMLTNHDAVEGFGGQYAWAEYSSYVGYSALLVGAFALPALWRRRPIWLVAMGFFGSLTLGNFAEWSPWNLLHTLPVFDSLRVPSRFVVLWLVYFSLSVGLGIQALQTGLRRRRKAHLARGVALALVVLIALELIVVTHQSDAAWSGPPIPDASAETFHLTTTPYTQVASFPGRNVGTRQCYEAYEVPSVPGLRSGEVPQAWSDAGTVLAEGRDLDRVWAVVELERPGRLVFNQRFDPGWQSNVGEVVQDTPRLEVQLDAGRHRVGVRFRPAQSRIAWWVSWGAWAAVALLWLSLSWRVRRRSLR